MFLRLAQSHPWTLSVCELHSGIFKSELHLLTSCLAHVPTLFDVDHG
jgi:hypothetical protein